MSSIELSAFDQASAKPGDLLILDLQDTSKILVNLEQNSTADDLLRALAQLPKGKTGLPYQVPENLVNQKVVI